MSRHQGSTWVAARSRTCASTSRADREAADPAARYPSVPVAPEARAIAQIHRRAR
jgi:hypothetical protein